MHKRLFTLSIFLISISLYSQNFEIVKTFQFDNPFRYYEEWDIIEGGGPGLYFFNITDENNILMVDSPSLDFFKCDIQDNYSIEEVWEQDSSFIHIYQLNGWIVINISPGVLRIYKSDYLEEPAYIINTTNYISDDNPYSGDAPYITEEKLFLNTKSNELVYFDLGENGNVIFHNTEETRQWFENGNEERIGHRLLDDDHFFGEIEMQAITYYTYAIYKDLIFPNGPFEDLSRLRGFSKIGYDSRGLNYYYAYGPPPVDFMRMYSTSPFSLVIAVVDTWTRNVTFRILPQGDWDPPRNEEGFLGLYPNAVHPNGDVYFYDADVEAQEFQLKRLANDWWAEFGVNQRRIGRFNNNYIPLRTQPNTGSTNSEYGYEHEFAWVQEEQNRSGVSWLLIRKVDGSEGWVLAENIDFE
ncbi:MAG: hypothetical protein PF447_03670 [Spirochaetaceae bacterium]|jgi:hypothetical protein|nr:hypothetical protein [Spirochaetaceae bacterium]